MKKFFISVLVVFLLLSPLYAFDCGASVKAGRIFRWMMIEGEYEGTPFVGRSSTDGITLSVEADMLFGTENPGGFHLGLSAVNFPLGMKIDGEPVDVTGADPMTLTDWYFGLSRRYEASEKSSVTVKLSAVLSPEKVSSPGTAEMKALTIGAAADVDASWNPSKHVGFRYGVKFGGPIATRFDVKIEEPYMRKASEWSWPKGSMIMPYIGVSVGL